MMGAQRVEFPGYDGSLLAARLDLPPTPPRAYALFAHCFTCGKDVLAASRISAALNAQGIAVLRFDFTGLGMSEGEFANTNFSSNVADLARAADFLRGNYEAPALLIGHSLGGAAVLSAAHDIPEARAVVTLGAPSEPIHVARQLGGDTLAKLDTEHEVGVSLAGRPFRIQRQFLDDLKAQRLHERITSLGCALLVMHAPLDEVVGIDQARRIFEAARHPKSFVAMDGANHLLTGRAHAAYAAGVIAAWVTPYLPEQAPPPALSAGQVRVTESGAGRYTQMVQAGRHHLLADEPTSVGGNDAGPGPFDYLLAALGACTTMTLRMVAERKGWQVELVEVTLVHRHIHANDCADCASTDSKVLEIERTIRLPASTDPAVREQLLDIADRCPGHRALSGEIKIRTRTDNGDGFRRVRVSPPISSRNLKLEKIMRAIWKDCVIAESDNTVVVEGNHYFPPESLKREHFRDSSQQSICPWKGTASYFDVVVNDEVNPAAAWYYPEPKSAAAEIRGHVAFWRGVTVQV